MLYFKEFNPMEVIIQKPRGIIKGLKPRGCHALVLFDLPLGVTLDNVIADCKTRVFDGAHLTLVRAFALREKLFSLQAPAKGAGLRIDGVVLAHELPSGEFSLENANTGCWYSDDEEIEPEREIENPVESASATPQPTTDAKVAKRSISATEEALTEVKVAADLKSSQTGVLVEAHAIGLEGQQEEKPVNDDIDAAKGTTLVVGENGQQVAQTGKIIATEEDSPLTSELATNEKGTDSPITVGEISLSDTAVDNEQGQQKLAKTTEEAGVGAKAQAEVK